MRLISLISALVIFSQPVQGQSYIVGRTNIDISGETGKHVLTLYNGNVDSVILIRRIVVTGVPKAAGRLMLLVLRGRVTSSGVTCSNLTFGFTDSFFLPLPAGIVATYACAVQPTGFVSRSSCISVNEAPRSNCYEDDPNIGPIRLRTGQGYSLWIDPISVIPNQDIGSAYIVFNLEKR